MSCCLEAVACSSFIEAGSVLQLRCVHLFFGGAGRGAGMPPPPTAQINWDTRCCSPASLLFIEQSEAAAQLHSCLKMLQSHLPLLMSEWDTRGLLLPAAGGRDNHRLEQGVLSDISGPAAQLLRPQVHCSLCARQPGRPAHPCRGCPCACTW